MDVLKNVSEDLNIPIDVLESQIIEGARHVKIIKIPKKSGGVRLVFVPPKIYKIFQYYIISNYLDAIRRSAAACAFWKGCSILKNAQKHKERIYLVRIDISDFFHSITFNDFVQSLNVEEERELFDLFMNDDSARIIRKTCFSRDGHLCVGYPISPFAADIAMRHIDEEIFSYLNTRFKGKKYSYSRYADDLVVGFDEKCGAEVVAAITKIVEGREWPKLSINNSKTRFFNRNVGNAIVTGVRICQDGRLTLPKQFKDDLRFNLSLLEKGLLEKEAFSSLEGALNHCRDIAPEFYTKLQSRYFKSIEGLIKRNRNDL